MKNTIAIIVFSAAATFMVLGRADTPVERLAKMRSGEVDVGTAALLNAKELNPDLDVDAYDKQITDLAREVHELVRGSTEPVLHIVTISLVLFGTHDFGYDPDFMAKGTGITESFDRYIREKRGTCFNMALLYMAVAQRAGYPVTAVSIPGHMFLRYLKDDGTYINIEPTTEWTHIPDEDYIRDHGVTQDAINSGGYMRSLTNREITACLITRTATRLLEAGRYGRALRYSALAVSMDPRSPAEWALHSAANVTMAMVEESAAKRAHYMRMADMSAQRSNALGYLRTEDMPLFKKRYTYD